MGTNDFVARGGTGVVIGEAFLLPGDLVTCGERLEPRTQVNGFFPFVICGL